MYFGDVTETTFHSERSIIRFKNLKAVISIFEMLLRWVLWSFGFCRKVGHACWGCLEAILEKL